MASPYIGSLHEGSALSVVQKQNRPDTMPKGGAGSATLDPPLGKLPTTYPVVGGGYASTLGKCLSTGVNSSARLSEFN
jgi:hypothetical protein